MSFFDKVFCSLVVYWSDSDGKEIRLTLMGEGDDVEGLSISKEN